MEGLGSAFSKVAGGLESAIFGIGDLIENVIDFISDILDAVVSLPEKIIDLLGDLLSFLFVPEDEFLSEHITNFRSKFAFVDSVSGVVEMFKDCFSNSSEFGSLEINLGNAESDYNWGGKVNVLNVSWYERYKPYGDVIISAILWGVFIFNVYKSLPGIINGAGGALLSYEKNKE